MSDVSEKVIGIIAEQAVLEPGDVAPGMTLEDLGLLKPQLATMKEIVAEGQGIVLLTQLKDFK